MAIMRIPGAGSSGGSGDYGFIPWSELNGQATKKITLGYKPKRIAIFSGKNATYLLSFFYDEDRSTTYFYGMHNTFNIIANNTNNAIGADYYWANIYSISNDGFTIGKTAQSYVGDGIHWFASNE